jgi:hypothetical protein
MTEQMETKTLQEEIRELEERARQAVDAAAAAREDESTTEAERQRLDEEAARTLDEAEAAKARLSRADEVGHAIQERQEEREQERRLQEAEEIRRGHEKRYNELAAERRKLEERAEKEAAKFKGTLEKLLELDGEQRREWALAGGKTALVAQPFKFVLGQWFAGVFAGRYKSGPVPTAGSDARYGAGLAERDEWAKEAQVSRAASA